MNQIKVGLFGFGKTGKLVANELISDDSFSLQWVVKRTRRFGENYASMPLGIRTKTGHIFSATKLGPHFFEKHPVDIIIDFSSAQSCHTYAPAAKLGVRIITAISKYEKKELAAVEKMAKQTAVLYSPNITLGINFLLVVSQVLQKIAPHADIEIVEEHFREKKETSGTALKIAQVLGLEQNKRVNSIRVGGVVGRHEVVFGLPNQTIRLVHESINRAAFGQGAIFGAKWLADKGPGLYTMEQILADMMTRNIPIY